MDEIKDNEKLKPIDETTELLPILSKQKWDFDDKDLAMAGIIILGIVGVFKVADPASVVMTAMAALGALATGRKKIE